MYQKELESESELDLLELSARALMVVMLHILVSSPSSNTSNLLLEVVRKVVFVVVLLLFTILYGTWKLKTFLCSRTIKEQKTIE